MNRLYSTAGLACLLFAGCGEETDSKPADPTPLTAVSGASASGDVFSVIIDEAVPDPPVRGDINAWMFTLTRDGAPVEGCAVEVEPTMPLHGHGTNPDPTTTEMGGGVYEMRPLNFIMPGQWHVAIRPTCGSTTDEVVLVVDIES